MSFFESPGNLLAVGGTLIVASGIGYLMLSNSSSSSSSDTSSLGKKEAQSSKEEEGPKKTKITVYFGSQTGTAEGFSRTLSIEGAEKGFEVEVVDLEDFEEDDAADLWAAKAKDNSTQVFLMATYGEGEPTDNANQFIRYLKTSAKDETENPLNKVPFVVFGLGNTQYEHYNAMGKIVDELLGKLGGDRLLELGMGDDDKALEDDFEAWKETVWSTLEAK